MRTKKKEKMNSETETDRDTEKEVRAIIGGKFTARIGEEGGLLKIKDNKEARSGGNRKLKDKKINKEGRRLLELMGEKGWSVLNGKMTGDEQGEYTGTRENTVID